MDRKISGKWAENHLGAAQAASLGLEIAFRRGVYWAGQGASWACAGALGFAGACCWGAAWLATHLSAILSEKCPDCAAETTRMGLAATALPLCGLVCAVCFAFFIANLAKKSAKMKPEKQAVEIAIEKLKGEAFARAEAREMRAALSAGKTIAGAAGVRAEESERPQRKARRL